MGSYIPSTPQEREEMLRALGLQDFRDLYRDVPQEMYLDGGPDIPAGMSDFCVRFIDGQGKPVRNLSIHVK